MEFNDLTPLIHSLDAHRRYPLAAQLALSGHVLTEASCMAQTAIQLAQHQLNEATRKDSLSEDQQRSLIEMLDNLSSMLFMASLSYPDTLSGNPELLKQAEEANAKGLAIHAQYSDQAHLIPPQGA
jgi:hypothetical protein